MNLNDTEEIVPLLQYAKRDYGVSNVQHNCKSENLKISQKKPYKTNDETTIDCYEDNYNGKYRHLKNIKPSSDEGITYSWKNLSVYKSVKSGNCFLLEEKNEWNRKSPLGATENILQNVYGVAHSGELLAIMGSSGAGKTTLLNVLTFHSGPETIVEGHRYLNGQLISNKNIISNLCAYVEQDNLFLGNLTVKEHLIFQALVRMERTLAYGEKLKRVEEVVIELGLKKCENTIIGYPGKTNGISGGEMKRLSFASEILTKPPIMFCDEPTSGLDSLIALNVIKILKSLAMKNKTVICTVHQPSSEMFALFDKILLLSEGRTAYLGSPREAVDFFNDLGAVPPVNYNPADFYIQMLAVVPQKEEQSRETIKFICDHFDQSVYGSKLMGKIETDCQIHVKDKSTKTDKIYGIRYTEHSVQQKYKASWLIQFRALLWRSWINIKKEALLVKVRLFQTLILSVAVGVIYHQQKLNENGVMNINGVLFTFLTNMTFQNLFAVISVFCSELPIFLKEHSSKMYRVDAYFLSKTLTELPMFFVIPTIFTAITYFWINLNPRLEHFGFTLLILILVTNVSTSFGYLISCISTNVTMALSIGPPVVIPFLLFGGFLLNVGVIPSYFKWLSFLSWFKYGNEALLINQWSDIDVIECTQSNSTCLQNGEVVLEIFHFQKQNFLWDLLFLILLIILFRLVAYLALFIKTLNYHRIQQFM